MVVEIALFAAFAYLLGSVPGAYIAARLLKGIDLRRYGSGTVSSSMVYEHVARWAVVPAGVFDVGKVALSTWAPVLCGLGRPAALAVGLAATIGHTWPVFLGFKGGRGIGGFIGILLVLFPWGSLWLLGLLAIGWGVGDSAPFALFGLLTLPVLARLADGPRIVLPAAAMMTALALAKRLEANRRRLPVRRPARRSVVLRRLLLDRDIPSHRKWIRRRPSDAEDAAANRGPSATTGSD